MSCKGYLELGENQAGALAKGGANDIPLRMCSSAQYVMLLASAGQGRCLPGVLHQVCLARDRGSNATASLVGASACVADDVDLVSSNSGPVLVCMP